MQTSIAISASTTATLAPPLPEPAAHTQPSMPAPDANRPRFTVQVATHHGLCFGVRDAIALAEKLAAAGPLTVLGELAHNPLVRARLAQSGIQEAELHAVGAAPTSRVMTTAHGAAPSIQSAWRRAGHTVIDGACPLVRHAHRELDHLIAAGCHPVIIGKPGHPEVLGLATDHPGASIVDALPDLAHVAEHAKYGVISQTTQPIAKVRGLVAELQRLHPHAEVVFRDTVCQPTKDRQRALTNLIETSDVVIVVGGRGSNNTRELVATCQRAGRRAHQVESADDLDPQWFADAQHVGLTAGTSTLPDTVTAVHARLNDLASPTASVPSIASIPSSRKAPTEPALTAILPADAGPGQSPSLSSPGAIHWDRRVVPSGEDLGPEQSPSLSAPTVQPPPFATWLHYFQQNRLNRREPDWTTPVTGSQQVIVLIAKSLAHLQLGESGEGTVLLTGAARRYADDPDYNAALALFIAEEGEHARLLAKIVERLGGHLVHKHWTHACFRVFRHAIGVRFELQILLIAEIVGTAFYRLLRKHGPDRVISDVCDLLLTDEDQHLQFHRQRFLVDQAGWSSARRFLWRAQLRFVLHCAGIVAWWDFAPTVTALGGSRRDFFAVIDDELRKVVH